MTTPTCLEERRSIPQTARLLLEEALRQRLGGPSVFPYQPVDLYKTVVVDAPYPGTEWLPSTGDDLFRRSLYTYWKRTVPHPVMTAFDPIR